MCRPSLFSVSSGNRHQIEFFFYPRHIDGAGARISHNHRRRQRIDSASLTKSPDSLWATRLYPVKVYRSRPSSRGITHPIIASGSVRKRNPCQVQDLICICIVRRRSGSTSRDVQTVRPFPGVPAALLSAADIEDYVRITGMLHPFYPVREFLKPASYEVRPGRRFVRWDENREKIDEVIHTDGAYILPLIRLCLCK